MRRNNKLSLVFKLGHSPPFITFLIDVFNTGRTVIIEKGKESGVYIKSADSNQALQEMWYKIRVCFIGIIPGQCTEKELGCMVDI